MTMFELRALALAALLSAGCGERAPVALSVPADAASPDARAAQDPPLADAGAATQAADAGAAISALDAGEAPLCTAQGEACDARPGASTCCAGSFCRESAYSPEDGLCAPAQADGEFCERADQCLSAACTDNVCGVPAECRPLGETCYGADRPCCAGSFCDLDPNTYGVGHCVAPRTPGAFCQGHDQCDSGNCVDNLCAERSPVSFARVYQEVLVAGSCTNGYCHGGGSGGLWLSDRDSAYRALVHASTGCDPNAVRVAPGDLAASMLWRKVAPGVAACGNKMPPSGPPLAPRAVELLEAWIAAGAPM